MGNDLSSRAAGPAGDANVVILGGGIMGTSVAYQLARAGVPDVSLIGEADADGVRFLYAAGFSGHGFLQGPAVGEVVRDLYLRKSPAFDVSCFDVDRFAFNVTRTELNII